MNREYIQRIINFPALLDRLSCVVTDNTGAETDNQCATGTNKARGWCNSTQSSNHTGNNTPASGFVGPGGALVIGFSAGIICYYATQAIKQRWKIDDSLDVFPVHGVGGILGTFYAGIFASDALGVFSGQGYNEGMNMASQVQVQIVGIVATFVYTGIVTYILLKLVDSMLGLRITEEDETKGLDLAEHDERGYDL